MWGKGVLVMRYQLFKLLCVSVVLPIKRLRTSASTAVTRASWAHGGPREFNLRVQAYILYQTGQSALSHHLHIRTDLSEACCYSSFGESWRVDERTHGVPIREVNSHTLDPVGRPVWQLCLLADLAGHFVPKPLTIAIGWL